ILFLLKKIYIKYGSSVSLYKALSIQFVAKYTLVLVPCVYYAFRTLKQLYIIIERIYRDLVRLG
ncbi:hypothetical protein GQ44DRAFT_638002, partial [Phaeosphaeriaceae sp. PMI808]